MTFKNVLFQSFYITNLMPLFKQLTEGLDQRRQLYSPLCVRHLQVLSLAVPRSYTHTDLTKLVKTFTQRLLHGSDCICCSTLHPIVARKKRNTSLTTACICTSCFRILAWSQPLLKLFKEEIIWAMLSPLTLQLYSCLSKDRATT